MDVYMGFVYMGFGKLELRDLFHNFSRSRTRPADPLITVQRLL